MPTKLYLHFPGSNSRIEVLPYQEIIAGRMPTCDIDLTRYMEGRLQAISRQHFKIFYNKGEGFVLVDISHNGTYLNNDTFKSERRILRNGDVLKLANDDSLIIHVSIEDDPDITETIDDPDLFFDSLAGESKSGLYFDRTNMQFVVEGHVVPHENLTRLETELLKYLYDNTGKICLFDEIASHVWSDPAWAPGNNTISRAVGNVRKKLEQIVPGAGNYIQNIRGQGYKVVDEK